MVLGFASTGQLSTEIPAALGWETRPDIPMVFQFEFQALSAEALIPERDVEMVSKRRKNDSTNRGAKCL